MLKKIRNEHFPYKNILYPVFFVIISGVVGSFLGAIGSLLFVLMFLKEKIRLEFLFVLFIFTFFLGDNFSGPLGFANNLRYVVLGVSFLFLLPYKLGKDNLGNLILPFSVVALIITLFFSPIVMLASFRAVSFWIVALVVFKIFKLNYQKNHNKLYDLLIVVFSLFVFFTVILMFLPFGYLEGRFKGLLGNPNGLGLLSLFLYAIISILKHKNETSFSKFYLRILLFFLVFFIILSGSRTAFMSIVSFEVILRTNKGAVMRIIAVLFVALCYLFISTVGVIEVIESLGLNQFLRVDTIGDASGRVVVWSAVWDEILRNPIFGKGIMYDNYFIAEYVDQNIGDKAARHWGGVWSSYFSLLLDVGIVGFLVYVVFYIKMLSKSLYKQHAQAFIIICFLTAITESWMASSMNAFTPMLFLYWAIQTQPLHLINSK